MTVVTLFEVLNDCQFGRTRGETVRVANSNRMLRKQRESREREWKVRKNDAPFKGSIKATESVMKGGWLGRVEEGRWMVLVGAEISHQGQQIRHN